MQNKKFPQSTSNHAASPVKTNNANPNQSSDNRKDGVHPQQPPQSSEKDGN